MGPLRSVCDEGRRRPPAASSVPGTTFRVLLEDDDGPGAAAYGDAVRPTRTDSLLALAGATALQLDLFLVEPARGGRAVTAVAALLLAATLLLRGPRPALMAVAAGVVVVASTAAGGWLTSMLTTGIVAMLLVFSVGASLPRRSSLLAAGAFVAACWVELLVAPESDYALASDLVFTGVVVGALPWLAGQGVREWRSRAHELEALTRQLAEEREQREALVVLDERHRIAREMHDVVAHSVSLMVVQAGGARRVLATDPGRATSALLAVEDAGREALAELRRVLGVLRGNDDAPEAPDLAPQPGTAQLPDLVARTRASGLPVDLVVSGEPGALGPGPDLAVYRVVQEALTNALKHAGRATARVSLAWGDEALEVAVVDDGRDTCPRPAGPAGHGLTGMRERLAAYGGELLVGAEPAGGFAVRARVPLQGER
jgi:signal transduction histidine kinase